MHRLKQGVSCLIFLLVASCASSLEYSMDAIRDGDFDEAREYLLEYCDKFSKKELLYPDPGSGISFFVVLAKLGSKEVLHEVYQRKYSRANQNFLSGGQFSTRILKLAQKWNDQQFLSELALRVEEESAYVKSRNYNQDKSYYTLIKFASFHRSIRKESITNLSQYWRQKDYSRDIKEFNKVFDEAVTQKAHSLVSVLSESVTTRVVKNQANIIKLSDSEELELIFKIRSHSTDKQPFDHLVDSMRQASAASEVEEKAAQDSLVQLRPRLADAANKLSLLRQEKRDLETSGKYTYEESVSCKRCDGHGTIGCHTCRSRGHCRHCDHGYRTCSRCNGHSRYDCGHCHGSCYVYVCERVWDPCRRCYVEKRVRVRCGHCHGWGYISCSCSHGRVTCGHCHGRWRCRPCRGSGRVDCPDCRNGIVIHIRRTQAGREIDTKISGAEREFDAINSRISHMEWIIRREKKRREAMSKYLQ